MELKYKPLFRLLLIRHGATLSNEEHRYLGRRDETLSENGRERLQKVKRAGLVPGADFLFVSPMKRCRETAQILYPALLPEANIIEEWREMDFGRWEGKNAAELSQDAMYQTFIDSGGMLPFPQGESREDFTKRTVEGFYRMVSFLKDRLPMAKTDKSLKVVAAVVHGGTIMALLEQLAKVGYFEYQMKNGEGIWCSCFAESVGVRDTGRREYRLGIEGRRFPEEL